MMNRPVVARRRVRRNRRYRLGIEPLEKRLLLAAGDPDVSFHFDGVASFPIPDRPHQLRAAALAETPDGKTVALLGTNTDRTSRDNKTIIAARLNPDGGLDPTFAEIGTREVWNIVPGSGPFGASGEEELPIDIAVDSEGHIFALGQIEEKARLAQTDVAITKFEPGGVHGLSQFHDFRIDGEDTVPDLPRAIEVDSEGRLYVASSSGSAQIVARLLPDGTRDSSFGQDGLSVLSTSESGESFLISDLKLTADGSVVAVGHENNSILVTSVDSAGNIATGFGADGWADVELEQSIGAPPKVALDADGRIVVAASAGPDFVAARLLATGVIDTSFATTGTAVVDAGGDDDLAELQIDVAGNLLLSGQSFSGGNVELVVARLSGGGLPDGTVGSSGVVVLSTPADRLGGMLATRDGGVILGLTESIVGGGFGNVSLIKLDGSLENDSGFGASGMMPLELFLEVREIDNTTGPQYKYNRLLPDDSLVIVDQDRSLKVRPDGTLDPTYGNGGIADPGLENGGKLLVSADGSYLQILNTRTQYNFAAVNEMGAFDADFGVNGRKSDDPGFGQETVLTDAVRSSSGDVFVLSRTYRPIFTEPENPGFHLTKYSADLERDEAFADSGTLFVPFPNSVFPFRVLADSTGNLIVVSANRPSAGDHTILFTRVTPQGQLDPSFGDDGTNHPRTPITSLITATLTDDDQFLVTHGRFRDVTTISKFDAAGDIVRTFGFDGSLPLDDPSLNQLSFTGTIAIDDRGRILLPAGSRQHAFEVLRLLPDGSIDSLFGNFGVGSVPATGGNLTSSELAFDSSGRIVSSGASSVPGVNGRPSVFRMETGASECGAAGCVRLEELFPKVNEAAGEAVIKLVRERGSTGVISVRLRSQRERTQEAFPGEDYTPIDTRVTFQDGQTEAMVSLPIVVDNIDEAPDTILLEIDEPEGGALLENPKRSRLTILRQGPNPVALDASFGEGGVQRLTLDQRHPHVVDAIQQPDGKIVVAGTTSTLRNPGTGDFLAIRFHPDGSLDESFSGNGIARIDFQLAPDEARAIGRLSDGKLILVGTAGFAFDLGVSDKRAALVRLTRTGELDRTFGDEKNGRLVREDIFLSSYTDVLVMPDDTMFVVGETFRTNPVTFQRIAGPDLVVQKLDRDGVIQTDFGDNGSLVIPGAFSRGPTNATPYGAQLALDHQGRLVVGGSVQESVMFEGRMVTVERPLVAVMSQAGVLDATFGEQGVQVMRNFFEEELATGLQGLVIDDQNRIVVAHRGGVFRLLPSGEQDLTLAEDGKIQRTEVKAVVITPNDRIWIAVEPDFTEPLSLEAFLPDGRPDPAINGTGQQSFPFTPNQSGATMMVLDGGEVLFGVAIEEVQERSEDDRNIGLLKVRGGNGRGILDFEAPRLEIDENSGTFEVLVNRSRGAEEAVTVSYVTRPGTALADQDYVSQTGELRFVPGQTVQQISIPLVDLQAQEGPESFFVDLFNPTNGALLGETSTLEVVIFDGPGAIEFDRDVYGVGESQGIASLRVARRQGSDGQVTARVRSLVGTATEFGDYVGLDQVVTFVDGQTSAFVPLRLIDDLNIEGVETIPLTLEQPTGGAGIGFQSQATVRLFDVETFQATTAGAVDRTFSANLVREFFEADLPVEYGLGGFTPPIGMALSRQGSYIIPHADFRVAQIRPDGSRDEAFGMDGFALHQIPSEEEPRAEAFVTDSRGRSLLVGRRTRQFDSDLLIVRYTDGGLLDGTFGSGGVVTIDAGSDERGLGITVDAQDRIYVAGSSGSSFGRQQLVARLLENGTLDTSFAVNGVALLPTEGRFEEATAVAVQSDGNILVAGHKVFQLPDVSGIVPSTADIVLMSLASDGSVNSTYGNAGRVEYDFEDAKGKQSDDDRVRKLIPLPDRRSFLIGSADGEFLVAKLNPDGSLDSTFGRNGYSTGTLSPGGRGAEGLDFANDAFVDASGAVTVVGNSIQDPQLFSPGSVSIARFLSDGRPDITFGSSGARLFSASSFASGARGVVRDAEGRIVIASEGGDLIRLIANTTCPPAGCIQFASVSGTADESRASVEIVVSRPLGSSMGPATVEYFTVNGTAQDGQDYEATSGTLEFDDLESTAVINIPILNDALIEGSERFTVVLAAPSNGAVLGAQFKIPVVIRDNEFNPSNLNPPRLSFGGDSFVDEDEGTMDVRISRLGAATRTIEFNYQTVAEGSATPGVDYTPVAGRAVIRTNESSVTIPIPIILDDEIEGRETFQLRLSGIVGATTQFSIPSRQLTIGDADTELICEAGPGMLRPEFGDGGLTQVDPNPSSSADRSPFASFVANSGQVVQITGLHSFQSGLSVVRYNADGSLDEGFGDDGIVRIDTVQNRGVAEFDDDGNILEDGFEFARAVRMLDDGRVLIAGSASIEGTTSVFVIRLLADGSLDVSFGEGGFSFTLLSNRGASLARSAVAPDGSIYLQGHIGVQWRADEENFYTTLVQGSSGIPVAYQTSYKTAPMLVKIGPDGFVDRQFGQDGGVVLQGAGMGEMVFDGQGRPLMIINQEIVRLNHDGSLDTSFFGGGFQPEIPLPGDFVLPANVTEDLITNEATVTRLITSPDGGFVVSGRLTQRVDAPDERDPLLNDSLEYVLPVSPDFEVNPSYGDQGAARFESNPFGLRIDTMAAQPDGRIVFWGSALGRLASARLHPSGVLDHGFGGLGLRSLRDIRGVAATRILQATDTSVLLSLQAGGRLAVASLTSGPDPGDVRLHRSDITVAEDGSSFELGLRRVCGVDGPISVTVSALDGTAVAGRDFVALNQVVHFDEAEYEKTITVELIDNEDFDGDREFTVELSAPTGEAGLKSPMATAVTILDDEQPGKLLFDGLPISLAEPDGSATITVLRVDGDGGEVTVQVSVGGTAIAGADHTFESTTLTFPNGVVRRELVIPIVDDDEVEPDLEVIRLTLSNPTGGAELGYLASTVIEISDDDVITNPPGGTFSLSAEVTSIPEADGIAEYTITRTGDLSGGRSVSFKAEGVAQSVERDLISTSGFVTFFEGQTSATFQIRVLDDDEIEGDEQFVVSISSANPIEANAKEVTTTIIDNDAELVEIDLGDAADSYVTTLATGGPRHVLLSGFSLGASIDAESDAVPVEDASSDAGDDGIIGLDAPLPVGITNTVEVSVALPAGVDFGLVQGWIDWNGDGAFGEDERVIRNAFFDDSETQSVDLLIPGTATLGESTARFRLSTLASLPPTGHAPDGEVEDYRVVLEAAPTGPPWQNPRDRFDVNDDGLVTAVGDVLPMINELNRRTIISPRGELPIPPVPPVVPPPYYDVSGDNLLTAVQDILPVINVITSGRSEGEGFGREWVGLQNAQPAVAVPSRERSSEMIPLLVPATVDAVFAVAELESEDDWERPQTAAAPPSLEAWLKR